MQLPVIDLADDEGTTLDPTTEPEPSGNADIIKQSRDSIHKLHSIHDTHGANTGTTNNTNNGNNSNKINNA